MHTKPGDGPVVEGPTVGRPDQRGVIEKVRSTGEPAPCLLHRVQHRRRGVTDPRPQVPVFTTAHRSTQRQPLRPLPAGASAHELYWKTDRLWFR